jgi:curved DNA-binding protein CbpA
MLHDYYAVLGVKPEAPLSEIKQAYRQLVRLHHPDLTGSTDDQTVKLINEAYAVLSDASRRTIYDIQRLEARRQALLLASLKQRKSASPLFSLGKGVGGFWQEMKKELRKGS